MCSVTNMSSSNQDMLNLIEKLLKNNQQHLENSLRKGALKQLQYSYYQLQKLIQHCKNTNDQRLLHLLLDSSLATKEYLENSRNFSTINLAGQINTIQFNLKKMKEHIEATQQTSVVEIPPSPPCIVL